MLITMLLAMLTVQGPADYTARYASKAPKASHKPDAGDMPNVFTSAEKRPSIEAKRL